MRNDPLALGLFILAACGTLACDPVDREPEDGATLELPHDAEVPESLIAETRSVSDGECDDGDPDWLWECFEPLHFNGRTGQHAWLRAPAPNAAFVFDDPSGAVNLRSFDLVEYNPGEEPRGWAWLRVCDENDCLDESAADPSLIWAGAEFKCEDGAFIVRAFLRDGESPSEGWETEDEDELWERFASDVTGFAACSLTAVVGERSAGQQRLGFRTLPSGGTGAWLTTRALSESAEEFNAEVPGQSANYLQLWAHAWGSVDAASLPSVTQLRNNNPVDPQRTYRTEYNCGLGWEALPHFPTVDNQLELPPAEVHAIHRELRTIYSNCEIRAGVYIGLEDPDDPQHSDIDIGPGDP